MAPSIIQEVGSRGLHGNGDCGNTVVSAGLPR